jgi:hypothetical protein
MFFSCVEMHMVSRSDPGPRILLNRVLVAEHAMSALTLSGIIFVLTLGGVFPGALLRRSLPEHHLDERAKDLVRLGVGLVATIAALVLGLLIAAAKGSFDTQTSQVRQITANLILLDNILGQYGPEARPVREQIRKTIGPFTDQLWREKQAGTKGPFETDGTAEQVYLQIQRLSPHDNVQSSLQSRAVQISNGLAQVRFLLFAESENLVSHTVSGSPGILAYGHIRELQPVLAHELDGLHLPFAVCVVGVVRNFFDIATELAFYRIAEHVKRATAKRPRNDMSLP